VRFQDGQTLYRQLLKTLRDKFQLLAFQSGIDLPTSSAAGNSSLASDSPATSAEIRFDRPQTPNRSHQTLNFNAPHGHSPSLSPRSGNPSDPVRSTFNDSAVFHHPGVIRALAVDHTAPGVTTAPPALLPAAASTAHTPQPSSAAPMQVAETQIVTDEFRAFQIHDCYIVVASDAGLEIIDQHALHERIMYESLRQRILAGHVESQRLLIPETIECSPVESAAVLESTELFAEMGFDIQDFGGTTLLVNSCPVLIPRGGLVRIVRDFAEKLVQADGKMARRDLLDSMLHTMSCRAAIKAGQRLTLEEMRELLRQRHLVNDSHHCPHGRPTSLTISRHSLDQQFGRLG